MSIIKDGTVIDDRVERRLYPSLQHGDLQTVAALVLHRTGTDNAASTLGAYAGGQHNGAHFLIDGGGRIYQTASLRRICWHVGTLLSRCMVQASCSPQESKTIATLLHEQGVSFGRRARNVSRHESEKKYPLRYPSNIDSIGIEVAGGFDSAKKRFRQPTPRQLESLQWLVGVLVKEFSLNLFADVYAHGAIARKEPSEGVQLLGFLLRGTAR